MDFRFRGGDRPERLLPGRSSRAEAEPVPQYLAGDAAPDLLIAGGRAIRPAVSLHRLRGGDEAIDDGAEVGVGVIQAEDEPARPDPAQCESFGAKIELEHPVVACRLRVADRPDRRQVGDPYRHCRLLQPGVDASGTFIPGFIERRIECRDVVIRDPVQELVSGRHDIGM